MLPPNINSQLSTQYQLSIITASRISIGLINETYRIDTARGSFILQNLNPIFASESIYDVDAVSQYLKSQGMPAQEIIRTRKGKLWVEEKGEIWRLLTYIPGEVYERIENPGMAYEAGKILGQFHRALADFKYEFRHHRPMHHATDEHLKLLLPHLNLFAQRYGKAAGRLLRSARNDTKNEVFQNHEEINKLEKIILKLPKLLLPKNLRKIITHGDPKVSNVIFQKSKNTKVEPHSYFEPEALPIAPEAPKVLRAQPALRTQSRFDPLKAIALIDLDDVGNYHSPLIELGDAFRSWCGGYEDDPNNSFDLEKFNAAFAGYQDASKDFLMAEEKKLIPQAIKLITLELASRFLRDYFEDLYFGWNPKKYKSRRDHNLARAKGQVALYNDIVKKEREIALTCSQ